MSARAARSLLEDWIDVWVGMLGDIGPKTRAKYKYFVEGFILPEFEGRELGSLEFEEIETWENAIPTRISARGTPYARSVAGGARSLLITILGDAVHAGKIDRNPAERRKGRRGRVRVKGRVPSRAARQSAANVITPFHALCVAERCALLSGRDIDFVMNVFAAWTGVRWGELMAVEGWPGKDSPLQFPRVRHPHLRRGLAAPRARRRSLQVGPEGWLLPGPGPAALPCRPDALGDGQPPGHLLLPARGRQADLQG